MKVGSVVYRKKVKGLSSFMTIEKIERSKVLCMWFDKRLHLNREWFSVNDLNLLKA